MAANGRVPTAPSELFVHGLVYFFFFLLTSVPVLDFFFFYASADVIAPRSRHFFPLSDRLGTASGRWLELLSTILIARKRKLVLMNVCEGNQTRTRVHSRD